MNERGWLRAVPTLELDDASRGGLRQYLGQAASYQLTGPRIGFLVALDLCSQKAWAFTLEDNCWVETIQAVGDSVPRKVVVFRVPGCRKLPWSIKTPPGSVLDDRDTGCAM
jgi:hypothetical protein